MTDILVVDGASVYIFSTENQKLRTLPFSDSYTTYNNNLINIVGRIFLFDGINVREFLKPTENFHIIKSMVEPYQKYAICKLSSTEVAIVGGKTFGGNKYYANLSEKVLSSCFTFNIFSNEFRRIAGLNFGRLGCFIVNFCGNLYCIGGHDGTYNLSSIERYDSNRDKWEVLDVRLKVARMYHQSVVHENLIITLGGCENYFDFLDSIEIFNTDSKQVTLIKTCLKIPRISFGCCKINSKIYIIGGFTTNTSKTKTVEILDFTDPYNPLIW